MSNKISEKMSSVASNVRGWYYVHLEPWYWHNKYFVTLGIACTFSLGMFAVIMLGAKAYHRQRVKNYIKTEQTDTATVIIHQNSNPYHRWANVLETKDGRTYDEYGVVNIPGPVVAGRSIADISHEGDTVIFGVGKDKGTVRIIRNLSLEKRMNAIAKQR